MSNTPLDSPSRRRVLQAAAISAVAGLGTKTVTAQEGLDTDIELGGQTSHWEGVSPSEIAGERNPTLELVEGEEYTVTWENLDGQGHNFVIRDETEEENLVSTDIVSDRGATQEVTFTAEAEMVTYLCGPHPDTMRGNIEIIEAEENDNDVAVNEIAEAVEDVHWLLLDDVGYHEEDLWAEVLEDDVDDNDDVNDVDDDDVETPDDDAVDDNDEIDVDDDVDDDEVDVDDDMADNEVDVDDVDEDDEVDDDVETPNDDAVNPTLELEEGSLYVISWHNGLDADEIEVEVDDEAVDDDALRRAQSQLEIFDDEGEVVAASTEVVQADDGAVAITATEDLSGYRDVLTDAEGDIEVVEAVDNDDDEVADDDVDDEVTDDTDVDDDEGTDD